MSPAAAAKSKPFLNPSHLTPPSYLPQTRAPRSMSPEPADSENVTRKKPRLGDSSKEELDCAMGKKVSGFEELGKAGGGSFSRESDGKLEGGEEGKEELGFEFDLNFPASELGKEGCAQLGQKYRTVIDLEDESECGEEREELGFGYGGNGDLGFGLGDVKGETFGEGVKRRSFGREDKGKEKVGDGDWLQLCTGAMLPAPATSGHSSGDRRSDSLSLGRN